MSKIRVAFASSGEGFSWAESLPQFATDAGWAFYRVVVHVLGPNQFAEIEAAVEDHDDAIFGAISTFSSALPGARLIDVAPIAASQHTRRRGDAQAA